MSCNKLFQYLFGISICLTTASAARLPGESIVEGDEAKPGQFPYHVSLSAQGYTTCGGGIIDDRYVLTAAHCVVGPDGKFIGTPIIVIAGINDQKDRFRNSVKIKVEKIYVPTSYDPWIDDTADIALLKLDTSFNFEKNSKVGKVRLPKDPQETYANEKVQISGFGWDWVEVYKDPITGFIDEDGKATNGKLKFSEADIVDHAKCQEIYGERSIPDNQICARTKQRNHEKPSGVCSGDSGSPLVHNGETIVGVLSTSPPGCHEDVEPGVYTRVSYYLKFIEDAKNDKSSRDIRTFSFK